MSIWYSISSYALLNISGVPVFLSRHLVHPTSWSVTPKERNRTLRRTVNDDWRTRPQETALSPQHAASSPVRVLHNARLHGSPEGRSVRRGSRLAYGRRRKERLVVFLWPGEWENCDMVPCECSGIEVHSAAVPWHGLSAIRESTPVKGPLGIFDIHVRGRCSRVPLCRTWTIFHKSNECPCEFYQNFLGVVRNNSGESFLG